VFLKSNTKTVSCQHHRIAFYFASSLVAHYTYKIMRTLQWKDTIDKTYKPNTIQHTEYNYICTIDLKTGVKCSKSSIYSINIVSASQDMPYFFKLIVLVS